MKNIFKKKNPIKKLRKSIKEYFFFRNKRPLFEVNLKGIRYNEASFKGRSRYPYFEYGVALQEVFAPAGIIDIGCANGYLLEYFYKKGFTEIKGLEGAEAAFKYMKPEIKDRVIKVDLSKDIEDMDIRAEIKKYYLVNCTEVGEHIPCKYEDIFLKNVEKFVGKYLILSWANTWEGWQGFDKQSHVNPRTKKYIKKKLRFLNLRFNRKLTRDLVKNMMNRNVHEHWIKRIMVFERAD